MLPSHTILLPSYGILNFKLFKIYKLTWTVLAEPLTNATCNSEATRILIESDYIINLKCWESQLAVHCGVGSLIAIK